MLRTLSNILDVLTMAVGALGGISLLVGGVGIVTIMTIAVTERTGEIGLLLALGARRGTILGLFLGEAVALSALGGLFGLVLGIGLAQLIHVALPALPVHTPMVFVVLAEVIAVVDRTCWPACCRRGGRRAWIRSKRCAPSDGRRTSRLRRRPKTATLDAFWPRTRRLIMHPFPLRLRPGQDLRAALEAVLTEHAVRAAFVLQGIGSLSVAQLRFAGAEEPTEFCGDLEILSLAGSLAADGAHLHIAISDAQGRVVGGHVAAGCIVRTTAEILLAFLPDHQFSRELDGDGSGFRELVVRPR